MRSLATRTLSITFALATVVLAFVGDATAQDRRVVIINATNNVVNNFYASNINRKTWEEDILGQGVLQPGQRVTVNIDDGSGACLFDFRAVLATGRRVESHRVNVCQISSWTIR